MLLFGALLRSAYVKKPANEINHKDFITPLKNLRQSLIDNRGWRVGSWGEARHTTYTLL